MVNLNMKKPSVEIMFLQEEMTRLLQPSIMSPGRPMLVIVGKVSNKWQMEPNNGRRKRGHHRLIRNSIGTSVLSSLKRCQASCELWHIDITLGNNHGNPSQLDFKDFEYLPNGSSTISVVVTDQLLQANWPESNTHFSILYAHPITQNRLNYKWFKIVKI